MADRSEAGSARRLAARRVPRGLLRLLLWLNVPGSLFAWDGDDWFGAAPAIDRATHLADSVFNQFPMTLRLGFPRAVPDFVVVPLLIAATAGCDWLIRRYLPPRLTFFGFVGFVAGWWVLGMVTFALDLFALWAWMELGVV